MTLPSTNEALLYMAQATLEKYRFLAKLAITNPGVHPDAVEYHQTVKNDFETVVTHLEILTTQNTELQAIIERLTDELTAAQACVFLQGDDIE